MEFRLFIWYASGGVQNIFVSDRQWDNDGVITLWFNSTAEKVYKING